jgi:hypothetical protein
MHYEGERTVRRRLKRRGERKERYKRGGGSEWTECKWTGRREE